MLRNSKCNPSFKELFDKCGSSDIIYFCQIIFEIKRDLIEV
jgi:hypothetical protein